MKYFTWPNVSKNLIIQWIEDGGIKASDCIGMIKANYISYKCLLSSIRKWTTILFDLIISLLLEHLLLTNLSDDDIYQSLSISRFLNVGVN